jgi:ATP-dependent RNA helicase RhlE
VHRIGRTGRAGASGTALSFCDAEERAYLKDIQKTINRVIPVDNEHPFKEVSANNGFRKQLTPFEAAKKTANRFSPGNNKRRPMHNKWVVQ